MSGKYFTGDQKLSKKLIGRTKEALRQRNVQFAQTHGDASDEELLDYVRGEAARLGMTPNAGEIIHRATEQQRVILMKKGIPFFRHRGLPL